MRTLLTALVAAIALGAPAPAGALQTLGSRAFALPPGQKGLVKVSVPGLARRSHVTVSASAAGVRGLRRSVAVVR